MCVRARATLLCALCGVQPRPQAANYASGDPDYLEEIEETDPLYDAAGAPDVDYDAAAAGGEADYDAGSGLYGEDPLYDDAVGQDADYDSATQLYGE